MTTTEPLAGATSDFRSRFTNDEWSLVALVPFLVVGTVCGADGEISSRELKTFGKRLNKWLKGGVFYRDPLYREVARALVADGRSFADRLLLSVEIDADRMRTLLRARLTPAEYSSFCQAVLVDALAVAGADGLKDPERAKWDAWQVFLGISILPV